MKLTDEMIKGAQETEKNTGVPASITLGQILLESSGNYNGMSYLAYKGNNLFGVKSFDRTDDRIYLKSGSGQYSYWKTYDSVSDSIKDHEKIISLERYKKYYPEEGGTVKDYADALEKGGYAENGYSNKLMRVIMDNQLTKYDTGEYKHWTNTESDLPWYKSLVGSILYFITVAVIVFFFVVFVTKMLNIDTSIKGALSSGGG